MKTQSAYALVLLALMASAFPGHGAPVSVPNFSFEDQAATPEGGGGNPNIVADWTANAQYYGIHTLAEDYSSTAPGSTDGTYDLFINNNNYGTSTLTSSSSLGTILNGTVYTLTIGLGNWAPTDSGDGSSTYGNPGNPFIELLALNTSTNVSTVISSNSVPFDDISNGTAINLSTSYTSGPTDTFAGDQLYIALGTVTSEASGSLPTAQAHFDDVRLDASAVPEPSTYAMMLAGLAVLGFCVRRKLA